MHRGTIALSPILTDYRDTAGTATGHYFWQDLITANWIFTRNPANHLDVGSRTDGFLAHLATFRDVISLDIRPMETRIPNLTFIPGDAQKSLADYKEKFDSVSSLHSIEHFGLARYGDSLDIEGHRKGLKNIASCVSPGGSLFVSFPIGKESVEFNAQRIIDPSWPSTLLPDFVLEEFVLIPWVGAPEFGLLPATVDKSIWGQAGLYLFRKL